MKDASRPITVTAIALLTICGYIGTVIRWLSKTTWNIRRYVHTKRVRARITQEGIASRTITGFVLKIWTIESDTTMLTTLQKIASLEQIRIELLSDTDSELATYHNEQRLARLAEIKSTLESLWCTERQERVARMSARMGNRRR